MGWGEGSCLGAVGRVGGQGGCERRIEVIIGEMQKKNRGLEGVRSSREWGVEGWGWLVSMFEVGGDEGYGGVNQE